MSRRPVLFLLGLAALAAPAAAAGPSLIADLNTSRTPEILPAVQPGFDGVELGGFLYFTADDGLHGRELWRSDGTAEGTELVSDICPGPCTSLPVDLTVFGNLIGFRATDGVHGEEVWVTDGTREGTRMPQDLCPGACRAFPHSLIAVGGRLFFVTPVRQGKLRERLMVTDGTAAGTRIVLDPDEYRPFRMIGEMQGRLAFIGPGNGYYSALWRSDGTPEGTTLVLDLCATPTCLKGWDRPFVVGDRIVFWDQYSGEEIWSSDGTASGTRTIGTTSPAFTGPGDAVLWKGSLYFVTIAGLWQSDGTPEGTRQLRSFPGWENRARWLLPLDDVLLFIAGDVTQGLALWETRGTPESTRRVSDPAPDDASAQLGPLTRAGDRVLFPVFWEVADKSEIWETDGTTAGTRRLASVCGQSAPVCRPDTIGHIYPAAVQGRYLFALSEETYGYELWTADAAGPRLVRDIHRNAGWSRLGTRTILSEKPPAPVRDLAAIGSRLVFSAQALPGEPGSLWASDGTAAGTVEIGPEIPWPQDLVLIGDRLWLRGSSFPLPEYAGRGLWMTDGTAAGTVDGSPDAQFLSLPGGRPGLVLAGADDSEVGYEPWVSDGTPGATRLLKDINTQTESPSFPGDDPVPGSSRPAHFTPLGSSVLFTADDGHELGREPWITDGTADGTRLLLDINRTVVNDGIRSVPGASSPGPFVLFGHRAYFAADDGVSGRELWSTDGTAAGTVRVRDLRPGAAGSNPRDLVTAGARLFFLADNGASDALWSVTPSGQAKRVRLLGGERRAWGLVAAGNRLFFVVDSAATGPELWTSDGTRPGTRLVREIRPGASGSYPQELAAVDNLLLFAADDGVHGLEPWVTDGTAAGTRLLADLAPGADASGPARFTVAGDLVGFDANDGVHGRELWGVRKEDLKP